MAKTRATTLCKGRYLVDGERYHALEGNQPEHAGTAAAGAHGGEHRFGEDRGSPAQPGLCRRWRSVAPGDHVSAKPPPLQLRSSATGWNLLGAMSEGTQTTLGAYHRKWR